MSACCKTIAALARKASFLCVLLLPESTARQEPGLFCDGMIWINSNEEPEKGCRRVYVADIASSMKRPTLDADPA